MVAKGFKVATSLIPVSGRTGFTLTRHIRSNEPSLLVPFDSDESPDVATQPRDICSLREYVGAEGAKQELGKAARLASIPFLMHVVSCYATSVTTNPNFIAELFTLFFEEIEVGLGFRNVTTVNVISLEEFKEARDLAVPFVEPAETVCILPIAPNGVVGLGRGNVTDCSMNPLV